MKEKELLSDIIEESIRRNKDFIDENFKEKDAITIKVRHVNNENFHISIVRE